ncbi:Cytosolic carboxypeptidase-like protein 5 [Phytophthora citrophthora]|uniref:tubulin-glutamate carboxypeptidase n=1 Tax=Phytophthora citrophthora TaxID=4793 RepID=A0AAD9GK50_9STRA|nr:Cytosolic carboxypeptidase-like protein 5 [Phytophthora citrophthora]
MASISAPEDPDASILHRVATTGPGKSVLQFPERGLQFSSRFDGGNMASVQLTPSGSFDVILSEDAAGFGISTGYSTWFYFEVERTGLESQRESKTTKQFQELHLTLANLNPQRGLFKNGYTVMHSSIEVVGNEETTGPTSCVFQDEKRWSRLPSPLRFEKISAPVDGRQHVNKAEGEHNELEANGPEMSLVRGENTTPNVKQERKIRVSFTYKFKFARERVRFAFCYPYTYTRVQEELATLDQQFTVQLSLSEFEAIPTTSSKIYYHRELLTRSLEGLRVDLLTISSLDGIASNRGPPNRRCRENSAFQFNPKQKRLVVISARVHSGETPANFMLDGMLQLLLHPEDESAISLRRHFVFKIIPMLNPDGVCQGFYRTDTRGVNLNRVYEDPQPDLAPSVFALKELLLELVEEYGGVDSTPAQENVIYLDLHAHANRRGCFIFGNNHLPDLLDTSNEAMEMAITRQVQTQLYARLVGLHTPFFDYMACLFDKENMTRHDLRDNSNATTSRQGSSRVALYRATGLTYVYTIECNYNEGRRNLRTSTLVSSSSSPGKTGQPKRSSSLKGQVRLPRQNAPTSGTRLYLKYSPAEWKDVGVGALIALLDLFELPGSGKRVEESPFRSQDGIRKNLLSEIKATTPGEGTSKPSSMNKQKSRQVKVQA